MAKTSFYIVRDEKTNKFKIITENNDSDGHHELMKMLFTDLQGCWGRYDFAEIWCAFYNDIIDNFTRDKELDRIQELHRMGKGESYIKPKFLRD